jgi:3-dehydro-4-phosphotetronate decarboxylase
MTDTLQAETLCRLAQSLFDRGLTPGSSGNISVRTGDGYLMTPTNSCFGRLDPTRLSRLDASFAHVGGDAPTKELPLHRAFYAVRGELAQAVVHLHSPYATALSIMSDTDPHNVLPPLTPYPIMRLGRVPLVPYLRPGDAGMEAAIRALPDAPKAVLLANHGPVVSDRTLEATCDAIEEFEQAAMLAVLLQNAPRRFLTATDIKALL